MAKSRSLSRLAGGLTAVLVLLAVVTLMRLAGVGVLVTQGTSMAPEFTSGDLAMTYRAGSYRVGDVVAYHSDTLNSTVLHRIVEAHGTWFVTRGDNNAWIDPDRPGRSAIKGRLLIRIPRLGQLVTQLKQATTGPPLVTVAAGLLMFAGFSGPTRLHPRRRSPRVARPKGAHRRPHSSGRRILLQGVLAVLAAATAAPIWLLARTATPAASPVTAVAPTATTASAERLVLQYTARTPAAATYADGRVSTGDPIFVNAVRTLTVTATHIGGQDVATKVSAELGHPTGWRLQVPMSDLTSRKTNTGTEATARLDIRAVADLLNRFANETGLPAPGATLALVAEAGAWSMRSELTYDGVQFSAKGQAFTAGRTAAAVPAAQPRRAGTSASSAQSQAISHWRPATIVALPVLLVVVGAAWVRRRRRTTRGSISPDRLLPIAAFHPADGRTIVDMRDAHQLHRSVDHVDRPILLLDAPDGPTYLVDDGAVIYRLRETATGFATGRKAKSDRP